VGISEHASGVKTVWFPPPPSSSASRRLVLAESTASTSTANVPPQPEETAVLRSWPEQANDDPSEVKRLRQSLSQAEQAVGLLKERLFDAKSAQARANHGLQDKDTRLAMLSKQFESSSSTQAHHAEVVETLQNELQRARQQVEALSQQALQMQGKLREIEDW